MLQLEQKCSENTFPDIQWCIQHRMQCKNADNSLKITLFKDPIPELQAQVSLTKPQVGLSEVSQDMNFVRFGLSYICGLPVSLTFDLPCWWFRCTCIHLTWFIFSHLLPCYWSPCPALVQLESHIHVLVSPWATLRAIHHFTTIILRICIRLSAMVVVKFRSNCGWDLCYNPTGEDLDLDIV